MRRARKERLFRVDSMLIEKVEATKGGREIGQVVMLQRGSKRVECPYCSLLFFQRIKATCLRHSQSNVPKPLVSLAAEGSRTRKPQPFKLTFNSILYK